ncbi:hypothetical protein HPB47_014063 [Ixodes persulcatus]|uniref:Uncharacterized protein n=1 Tax=Ixodes persulcatus TaxID=34615 RepID=A0AC60QX39_IXOPE|nr:hypothetical protein HPB47_014063 [Ixodes persulcatus]
MWWTTVLNSILKTVVVKDKGATGAGLLVLGEDVQIPENVSRVLQKGPKYCLEPSMAAHDLLALNRRVARKAPSEQHDSCLLAGVDVLTRTVNRDVTRGSRDPFVKVVDFFKENDLRLLQADKEGGFVAMTAGTFSEKARLAVEKNFKAVKPSACRVKS